MSAAIRLPSLTQPVTEARLSGVFLKDLDHSFGGRISRKCGTKKPSLENCHINDLSPVSVTFFLAHFLIKNFKEYKT